MVRKFAPIALALLLVACGGDSKNGGSSDGTTPAGNSGGSTEQAMPGTPAAEPFTGEPGMVVAKVGSDEITLREADLLANTLRRNRPQASLAEMQKMALDNLIDQRVLLKAANERNIGPTDDDVNAAIAQIQGQFPNEEAFTAELQKQGMTRDDFDQNFRTELTIQKLIEEAFADTVKVSDAEAKEYYEANPAEFQQEETVHARHILFRVDQGAPPEADVAARQKADAALARVRGGEDFAAVANELTEDPSGRGSGGDLGFFPRRAMVAPFSAAAFALEPGQISDPVKTQFGYHLIKVEEKKAPGPIAFDEIKDRLQQGLEQQKLSQGVRAFIDREKSKLPIEREF